jgi:bifunctional non-homologous end joining protein LigD
MARCSFSTAMADLIFGMLQRALGSLPSAMETGAIAFLSFDLLYLDGRDLRRLPLRERRRLLEPLVAGREGAIRLSEEVDADGSSSALRAWP